MTRYIGVDIGNSGARVAELSVDSQTFQVTKRIYWRQPLAEATADSSDTSQPAIESENRFLPTEQEWAEQFCRLENRSDLGHEELWLISSVRRDASNVLLQALERRQSDVNDWLLSRLLSYDELPIELEIERPESVGIDRLLAAIAANAIANAGAARPYSNTSSFDRSAIVIQAGSAVTVDWITRGESNSNEEGPVFHGGAIAPGIPMMLRLLGDGADMLPKIDADELTQLPTLPGKNTIDAMKCGAASAFVGGVVHLVQRYREASSLNVPVILSGGDGFLLAPYIDRPLVVEPDLVLRGLLCLAIQHHDRA